MSFEILPHTADVRLKVVGESLEELFSESLKGMNELMHEGFCKKKCGVHLQETISIHSQDSTALLIDFLSEVLTLSHIYHAIFGKVEFKKLDEISLEATVYGSKTPGIEKDVKAVSYHEAQIKQTKSDQYETTLVFDI